jgi:hypothetical protein
LICNVPYNDLLKLAEIYSAAKITAKQKFPNHKVNPIELLDFANYYVNVYDKIEISKKFFSIFSLELPISSDPILSQKWKNFRINENTDDMILEKFLQGIRTQILINESEIYDTTDPNTYTEIIVKYMIKWLTEIGY